MKAVPLGGSRWADGVALRPSIVVSSQRKTWMPATRPTGYTAFLSHLRVSKLHQYPLCVIIGD